MKAKTKIKLMKQSFDELNDGVCECGHHSSFHRYSVYDSKTLALECNFHRLLFKCNCKNYKFKEFPRERRNRLRRLWQKKWRETHMKEHLLSNSRWRKAHREHCNKYLREWLKRLGNYERYIKSQIKYYKRINNIAAMKWWQKQLKWCK